MSHTSNVVVPTTFLLLLGLVTKFLHLSLPYLCSCPEIFSCPHDSFCIFISGSLVGCYSFGFMFQRLFGILSSHLKCVHTTIFCHLSFKKTFFKFFSLLSSSLCLGFAFHTSLKLISTAVILLISVLVHVHISASHIIMGI